MHQDELLKPKSLKRYSRGNLEVLRQALLILGASEVLLQMKEHGTTWTFSEKHLKEITKKQGPIARSLQGEMSLCRGHT